MAYRANTGFRLPSRRIVHAGDLIASDDPDVKFMLKNGLVVDVDEWVEQATAAPGEKRNVKKPKKKATK